MDKMILNRIKECIEPKLALLNFELKKIDYKNKEFEFLYLTEQVQIKLFVAFIRNGSKPSCMIHVCYKEVKNLVKQVKISNNQLKENTFVFVLERLLHKDNSGLLWKSNNKIDIEINESEESVTGFIEHFSELYVKKIGEVLDATNTVSKADILINEFAIKGRDIKILNYSSFLIQQLIMGLLLAKIVGRSNFDFIRDLYKTEIEDMDKSLENVKVFNEVLKFVDLKML